MVKVAVIGCGLMGIKIAGELMLHGHHVVLHDRDKSKLNFAKESLEKDRLGLIKDGFPKFVFKRGTVLYVDSLKLSVQNASFIVEAIVENLPSKQNIFKEISAFCPKTSIICSGTMSLDLDEIVKFVEEKERTIGVRFLYPVLCIPEVEVTENSFTSQEVLNSVHKFLLDMGKQPILKLDDPFVLTNDEAAERRGGCLEKMMSIMPSPPLQLSSSSSSSSPPSTPLNIKTGPIESSSPSSPTSRECAICMDAERDTLLCPCRHLVTCSSCSWSLIANQELCPICRASIQEILHVYHS